MDIAKSLSIKDFFNYYFAGVIWLLDLAILLLPFSDLPSLAASLQSLSTTGGLSNTIILAVLLVVLPYIAGFALNPLGDLCVRALRKIFGDPVTWITYPGSKSSDKEDRIYGLRSLLMGKRLLNSSIKAIIQHAEKISGVGSISANDLHKRFFYIRAYVVDKGGANSELAIRANDLAHLAESLLVPVPLFFINLGAKVAGQSLAMAALLWIAAIASIVLLTWRYFRLRGYWAKHIYRAFLMITAEKPDPQG